MRTLQEIKNNYAQSCYYNDWDEMCQKQGVTNLNLEEIVDIYANERINESLKEASEITAKEVQEVGENMTMYYDSDYATKEVLPRLVKGAKEAILKLQIK